MKLQNFRRVYRTVDNARPLGQTAKAALAGTAVLCAAGALPILLLRPAVPSQRKSAPFRWRNFAHRGLHDRSGLVPENSLAAFRAAAEAGYGIELDVQLSRDGQVVVFHDADLRRLCGVDQRVDALNWTELRGMRLQGSDAHIPLFSEALQAVDGRVPLIVELKPGSRDRELCEKTRALLDRYNGDVCVESFSPKIVSWFRFHAPELLRGQLSMPRWRFRQEGFSPVQSIVLSGTFLNFLAKPEFIAYSLGPRPLPVRIAQRFGALRFGWTAHSPAAERGHDAVIFEYYRPRTRYIPR